MSKLVLKGKNVEITDAIRDYVEKKFAKLDKYSHHIVEVVVELNVEKNPRIADNKIVMVNIFANGAVLRGEEASPDMYASIDMVLDKLERQLKKYEEKKMKNVHKQKTSQAVAEMADISNDTFEDVEEPSGDEKFLAY